MRQIRSSPHSVPFNSLEFTRSSSGEKYKGVSVILLKQRNNIQTYLGMEVIRDLAISTIVGRPSATTTRPPAIKNTRHVFSAGFSIFNFSSSSP